LREEIGGWERKNLGKNQERGIGPEKGKDRESREVKES